MTKRVRLAGFLVVALFLSALATLVVAVPSMRASERDAVSQQSLRTENLSPAPQAESTQDIGYRFPPRELPVSVQIKPATFVPRITREQAVSIARQLLRTGHFIAQASDATLFPAHATVALFTGPRHDVKGVGTDVKAWIVVIKGPLPAYAACCPGNPVNSVNPQYNLVIDAETGVVLYSVMNAKIAP